MLSLNEVVAMLEGGVSEEQAIRIIQENEKNGELFREAAKEGHVNVVKFFLDAHKRFKLTPTQQQMCVNATAADAEGNTPLHHAAARGHEAVVEAIISHGPADMCNVNRETPLIVSCNADRRNIVNILMRHHAKIKDWDTLTPALDNAIKNCNLSIINILLDSACPTDVFLCDVAEAGQEDMFLLILNHEAYQNRLSSRRQALCRAAAKGHLGVCRLLYQADVSIFEGSMLETPLHHAVEGGSIEVTRFLLTCGLSVDSFDQLQQTPLHYAAKRNHLDIVLFLLSAGANINAVDKDMRTPIFYASSCGHLKIVQILLMNNARSDVSDVGQRFPLDAALENNHREVALLLDSHRSPLNTTELIDSALQGNRMLALLCLLQIEENLKLTKEHTYLHFACKLNCPLGARILLERGACVNAKMKTGETPLHLACKSPVDKDMVQLLLKHGASVNITDLEGRTPLTLTDDFSVRELLIKNGGDVHMSGNRGTTLLHQAKSVKLVQQIIECNALIDARDQSGNTPLMTACKRGDASIVQLLIENGASVNTRNKFAEFPLEYAILSKNTDVVRHLVENGADVNTLCKERFCIPSIEEIDGFSTPFHLAIVHGYPQTTLLLIEHGAKVNIGNSSGKTPLHLASRMGYEKHVEILLQNGADVTIKDMHGETPIQAAKNNSQKKVMSMLMEHFKNDPNYKSCHWEDLFDKSNVLSSDSDDESVSDDEYDSDDKCDCLFDTGSEFSD